MVLREATRRGFTEAARSVVLGDGSTWIWNTARELFPQAVQILDRYHAKEALHARARRRFSAPPRKPNHGRSNVARNWTRGDCATLSTNSAPLLTLVPKRRNACGT